MCTLHLRYDDTKIDKRVKFKFDYFSLFFFSLVDDFQEYNTVTR